MSSVSHWFKDISSKGNNQSTSVNHEGIKKKKKKQSFNIHIISIQFVFLLLQKHWDDNQPDAIGLFTPLDSFSSAAAMATDLWSVTVNQRNMPPSYCRRATASLYGEFKMDLRNTAGNEKVRDKEVQKGRGGGVGGGGGGREGDTEGEVGHQGGGDKGKKDAAQISFPIWCRRTRGRQHARWELTQN